MGLTIHYRLHTNLTKEVDVRVLVESMRQYARDLPFQEVGNLVELKGDDASSALADKNDELRWLKIQAGGCVEQGNTHYTVEPRHIIGFVTMPGEGCEPANFGFCLYPPFIHVNGLGRKRRLATRLEGWSWRSFCKTQYASDPEAGGVENFLRCHLCVIKLLDFVKNTGLVDVEVSDEGHYWENRDLQKLGSEVGEWNQMIAAMSGLLKDEAAKHGITLVSAIAGFPNFEHLEAQGQKHIQQLRDSLRRDA